MRSASARTQARLPWCRLPRHVTPRHVTEVMPAGLEVHEVAEILGERCCT
jgi:hypothetical protein